MEKWLSKPRVLWGLSGVVLVAALNRADPMLYGMFLFLAWVCVLGYLLPWLSLRSVSVRLNASQEFEVMEGTPVNLGVVLEKSSLFPSFMVTIESHWRWNDQNIVVSQTLAMVRRGQLSGLASDLRFACRGYYELVAVRISSGFPLGLMVAHHTMPRPDIHVLVLPRPQKIHWPLPWELTADPQGELTTRRLGQSYELGVLRPYHHGESVGRVSWGASARAGELIIQHFQQSGTMRLRLVMELPKGASIGQADSAIEQAIRLAAGIVDECLTRQVQVRAYLPNQQAPAGEGAAIARALAMLRPSEPPLFTLIDLLCADARPGEQVAVVVTPGVNATELLQALGHTALRACSVVVCIAVGRQATPSALAQARSLQQQLTQAGANTWLEAPCA